MKIARYGTGYLAAYFEDSNNDPVTGQNANVKFHWRTTDDSSGASDLASTSELGGGWYQHSYTDEIGKPIVYWATLAGYKNFPGGIVEIAKLTVSSNTATASNIITEQTIFTAQASWIDPLGPVTIIKQIALDMANMTQDAIIRVKKRIDGSTFRTVDSITWNTSMDAGIVINGPIYFTTFMTVTIQSLALEGASRSIPYQVFYEPIA